MAGEAPLQFRGIGGIYKIQVQESSAVDEYTCACNWLLAAITAQVGHSRVYNGWVPETVTIAPDTEFVTFVWDRSDPIKYTHGQGVGRVRVVPLYFEIIVWVQSKEYTTGIRSTSAGLVGALDVAHTDRGADGVILGAERVELRVARAQI